MQREESSPACLGRRGRSAGSVYAVRKNSSMEKIAPGCTMRCDCCCVLDRRADLIIVAW